jgi:MFS family permease
MTTIGRCIHDGLNTGGFRLFRGDPPHPGTAGLDPRHAFRDDPHPTYFQVGRESGFVRARLLRIHPRWRVSVAASRNKKSASAASVRPELLLGMFGLAIFLSAGLLFAVQPLFTKIVLPILGGAPAVWSVALVFFQGALLAGYLYAHLLTRHLPGRQSVIIHLIVLFLATLALPLGIAAGWGRPPVRGAELWLIGLFAVSIGLPFFALSANAPLLQAWFARTGHPSARDPYFLYAASNIGSFLALLSYPFLVEPFSRLGQQTTTWSILFFLLIAMIAVCGVLLLRSRNALPAQKSDAAEESEPTWRDAAI